MKISEADMTEPKAICELLAKLLADQQGKKITRIEIKGVKNNEDNI